MKLAAAQHIHRCVDGCAAKVRGRQRNILDVSTPCQDTHEDRLEDVLGVGRIAGDTQRRAEHRLVMALVQLGKPRERGRGSHEDRQLVDGRAGCCHLSASLTMTHEEAGYYMVGGKIVVFEFDHV